MTPTTLRALRQHLFFSVDDAAELIGEVSPRSWQYWESGGRPIPQDVKDKIEAMCAWRDTSIRAAKNVLHGASGDPDGIALVWYSSPSDWASLPGRDALMWRPHCSVIAELCASFGAVAVPFDPGAYLIWLGGRTDREDLRSTWAAQK
mgnify:CR=1 FL=1